MQEDVPNPPEWDLHEVNIKDIKEHPKNPRYIRKEMFDRLDKHIKKHGLIDKPILNQDMVLIGGHQRVRLLKKNKVKKVKCWLPDRLLSDADVEEVLIGNNLYKGEWDYDHMANNFDVIDLLEKGFSEEQLMGQAKEAEELLADGNEDKKAAAKKKKSCPNCGHEF